MCIQCSRLKSKVTGAQMDLRKAAQRASRAREVTPYMLGLIEKAKADKISSKNRFDNFVCPDLDATL